MDTRDNFLSSSSATPAHFCAPLSTPRFLRRSNCHDVMTQDKSQACAVRQEQTLGIMGQIYQTLASVIGNVTYKISPSPKCE
ncbi:hypothetical protein ElyMa_001386300 [Elysia marginata]|uniref:Uncharacterized protein n=1 Tax=Elysia marginata TaxID=1093978 RepID=A0AAV4IR07_9GAST|nr:hypothetical protein ElyMa_001386300 [Elysia marginata]